MENGCGRIKMDRFIRGDSRIPDQNIKRLNKSLRRMSMPPLDEKLALEALIQLVEPFKYGLPVMENGCGRIKMDRFIRGDSRIMPPSLQI
jgi:branched-subunit amino acid aminotransferase/4-amino-4-deoxychorismate lyase